jgi:hypothetical protein
MARFHVLGGSGPIRVAGEPDEVPDKDDNTQLENPG